MKFIFYIFLILNFSPMVHAACGLSFTAGNISINWSLNFATLAVSLQVDKAGPDACDFGFGFTKGGAASYASRQAVDGSKIIRYQLYGDSARTKVLKDNPDITGSVDVIQSGFQAGSNMTQTVLYYLDIPYSLATTPTLSPSGTFTDTYTISLYEGSDPMAFVTPVATANVSLTITVPPMILLSLVNSGVGFQTGATSRNANFGTLAEGQSHSFDLRVRTNAGFSVTFSSANNGKLKPVNPLTNSQVPYMFYANSALLDLSNSLSVPVVGLTGSGQTNLDGLAYPIRIVIGSLTAPNILGGPHQDSITITATTTE